MVYTRKLIILGLVVASCVAVAGFFGGYKLGDSGSPAHQSYVRKIWIPEGATFVTAFQIGEAEIKSERLSLSDFQQRGFSKVTVFRDYNNTEFLYIASSDNLGDVGGKVYSAKLTVSHGSGHVTGSSIDPTTQEVRLKTEHVVEKYALPWVGAVLGFLVSLIAWFFVPAMIHEARNRGASPEITFSV